MNYLFIHRQDHRIWTTREWFNSIEEDPLHALLPWPQSWLNNNTESRDSLSFTSPDCHSSYFHLFFLFNILYITFYLSLLMKRTSSSSCALQFGNWWCVLALHINSNLWGMIWRKREFLMPYFMGIAITWLFA